MTDLQNNKEKLHELQNGGKDRTNGVTLVQIQLLDSFHPFGGIFGKLAAEEIEESDSRDKFQLQLS